MEQLIKLSYEDWLEKFRPIRNHIVQDAPFDQLMFETYGPELDYVRLQRSVNIWTLIDGDDDEYIVDGYHIVNRVGYFITEVPYTYGEQFEINLRD